jgi:hypothetical protein
MQMVDKVRWVVFIGINVIVLLVAYFYADPGNWFYWLGGSLVGSAWVVNMIRAETPGEQGAESSIRDSGKKD